MCSLDSRTCRRLIAFQANHGELYFSVRDLSIVSRRDGQKHGMVFEGDAWCKDSMPSIYVSNCHRCSSLILKL